MVNLTIEIPDDIAPRIIEALSQGWDGQGTKAAFAKRQVIEMIRDRVRDYEANKAKIEAYNAAFQKAETDIVMGD